MFTGDHICGKHFFFHFISLAYIFYVLLFTVRNNISLANSTITLQWSDRDKKNALIVNEKQDNTNIITFLLRHLLLNRTQQSACCPTTPR